MPVQISLKDVEPVAQGLNQQVYQYPGKPDLLIKTLRLEKAQRRYMQKRGFWVKRRHGIYTGWVRELNEYLALRARHPGEHPACLQKMHGFVETDVGLGLVVGKVTDRSGGLAPRLWQKVLRDGLTAQLRAQIEGLRDWLNAHQVVTNDLNKSNILCAWNETQGDHLVIVEGLGDHNFIPLLRFSRRLNERRNTRRFDRMLVSLERFDRQHIEHQKADANSA
jgi:hypothetical protein